MFQETSSINSATAHSITIDGEHQWETVHHYDDQGRHYCPTGFEMCIHCADTRPGPATCHQWGQ